MADTQSPRMNALEHMFNPTVDESLHQLGKLADISGNPLVAAVEAKHVASVCFTAMTVIRRLQKEAAPK
jgi:hypothetical protein